MAACLQINGYRSPSSGPTAASAESLNIPCGSGRLGKHERLAEYGWKPEQKTIPGLSLLLYACMENRGVHFIEFEISSSTISTVFRQPLKEELLPRVPRSSFSRGSPASPRNLPQYQGAPPPASLGTKRRARAWGPSP